MLHGFMEGRGPLQHWELSVDWLEAGHVGRSEGREGAWPEAGGMVPPVAIARGRKEGRQRHWGGGWARSGRRGLGTGRG